MGGLSSSDFIEFSSLNGSNISPIQANLIEMFIHFGDKNDDDKLTKTEYSELFHDLLRDILDTNGSGALEQMPEEENPMIEFRVFEMILKRIFEFFDRNDDAIISLTEDISELWMSFHGAYRGSWENQYEMFDHNEDGVLTLEEMAGSPPISWPYPVYKLYSVIDVNKDEQLDLQDEAILLLKKAFDLIEVDRNGYISMNEILNTLRTTGLPEDKVVAVKIFLQGYSTLIQFLVNQIVKRADSDADGSTGLDEILRFDDWEWLQSSLAPVVTNVGYPQYGLYFLLAGNDIRGHPFNQRGDNWDTISLWLNVLVSLLEKM